MAVIVGSIICKENKILMIKEKKAKCYGKWSLPAGHLEINETIVQGAKRETLEETGYSIELKKVFPVFNKDTDEGNIVMIVFLAELIDKVNEYRTEEIMETKWIALEELKTMKKEEFRDYDIIVNIINAIEKEEFYDLELIKLI